MKTFFLLLISTLSAFAEPSPTVDVYLIRQMGELSGPEVILEVANPTKETFYVTGGSINHPVHTTEALRDGKWLRIPQFICGTGHVTYPLRPGAKMLVQVDYPWDERSIRYRFLFWKSEDRKEVVSAWTRAIERKELGDFTGTIGELESNKELEKTETDEELNKAPKPVDPFAPSIDPLLQNSRASVSR